ncbi:EAL domain-containing protein [Rhizobium cremeum]|uniref:sensor domain-containing protein n=1 Tax=Rhizobium cremeum TaxID=2813827 RepID=UPI001FD21031|nr:bifunctional diguanylate cyclase/phosphodiesterase [Rhizobium cremeum]MCJ7993083.1 EAL domain-containing protein [Rhizobium cremeum]MCJ7998148.1 EAL domain-containing protein [Rhizobium cremeum]
MPSVVLDPVGRILATNDRFDALPLPPGEPSGALLIDYLQEEDRNILAVQQLAALSGKVGSDPVEVRFITHDGFPLWMSPHVSTIPADGQLAAPRLLVQLADITQLKVRELDLADRESRWNNALVSSSTGVWDHRLDLGIWYYSEEWRAIRGLRPDDPLPPTTKDWLQLVHPDDRERTMRCIERQNAGDADYMTFEYRERHKDGHWVWIECRGACVSRDENGKPLRIIGTDVDITSRKLAEEKIAHMSRRLKLALEVSRIGVFEADFDKGTADWDEGMRTLFGIEGHQDVQIGGIWENMLHPEDAPRVFSKVEHHVEKLLPFSDEYRVILKDGSTRYIRSRTLPFIDADGHRKMIGANWDVTTDLALHRELERAKILTEARNAELEAAKARIEHIALHDYLTDLPNRRYLDETLDRYGESAGARSSGLAVLHIDLDRFKQINDTLGHSAGDMMLKHAAKVLKANTRVGDFVARIGGDEFVFLARFEGSQRKLAQLADRIIGELRKPVSYEGHECRFGASIGIACALGPEINARQLLLNADIALYHAKNRGRNRHEFFSRDSHRHMVNTRRLSDDILRALENDEFVPHYQFQFDARTLAIAGAEALARWDHPKHGILTPDRFLSVAEELGAVPHIDALILEKALADFERWRALGLTVPKISVNVSTRRLHDPLLRKKLSAFTLEPGTVSFELLESIFLDEYDDQAMENLNHLRKLGVDIEIDDFGTGHASIVSLLRLNPKSLKIDRELVRDVPESTEQRKLVGSIIDIGRSLNIGVTAEGVETPDHVRILAALGCDVLQGFGLARPLPFELTADFIAGESWRRPFR